MCFFFCKNSINETHNGVFDNTALMDQDSHGKDELLHDSDNESSTSENSTNKSKHVVFQQDENRAVEHHDIGQRKF